MHLATARQHLKKKHYFSFYILNLLTPNVNYSGRTAPLTSKVAFYIYIYIYIKQIYVLNILNMVYTLRFFFSKCSLFHNFIVFGSVLFTFYIQGVLKLKKIIPAAKG